MHRYIITDSHAEYRRISKREARTRFEQGEVIAFCPVKLRPGFPFSPHIAIKKNNEAHYSGEDKFETRVSGFEYHNCSNEAGTYTAFYRIIDRNKPAHPAIGAF